MGDDSVDAANRGEFEPKMQAEWTKQAARDARAAAANEADRAEIASVLRDLGE